MEQKIKQDSEELEAEQNSTEQQKSIGKKEFRNLVKENHLDRDISWMYFNHRILQEAEKEMHSGKWDMLILDEINYAVKFGLIEEKDVLRLLENKPAQLHLILTGRDARPSIIAQADLVTEMKLIKHPFQKGIKAQKGIEF